MNRLGLKIVRTQCQLYRCLWERGLS